MDTEEGLERKEEEESFLLFNVIEIRRKDSKDSADEKRNPNRDGVKDSDLDTRIFSTIKNHLVQLVLIPLLSVSFFSSFSFSWWYKQSWGQSGCMDDSGHLQ